MKANKCPCEKCISYAICIRPHKITQLLLRCCILANYINNMERAYNTIKVLAPFYYDKRKGYDMAFHEPSAKAILKAAALERDELFKKGVE